MLNKVILIGNVGADPEVRSLEGGVKVARLRVATTERSYNRQTQEAKEFTEWHSVTLWRQLADFADRFVKKGSQVFVEGSIRSREWTDDAGNKRFGIEIVANDLKLLGRRQDSAGGSGGAGASGESHGAGGQSQGGYASGSGQQGGSSQGGGYASAPQGAAKPQAAPAQEPLDDPDDLPF